ncbi:hypothetical protein CTAYLR_001898 [Chrysophaeum taylorii]|uniref:ABC transporter domain-containing protein n=1 Tax=Chrysophaeum taylorii TaxID=2483200 RepID=A0AAD7U895_9STRA|nr:hypothetical protein CTAYLR_001898 [Chrysophaeum taylorii]
MEEVSLRVGGEPPTAALHDEPKVLVTQQEPSLAEALQSSVSAIGVEWHELQAWAGQKEILRGLSGEAYPGEVVAILGPSGGGKSTLLSALSGRFSSKRLVATEISYNGGPWRKAFKRRIGFVEQDDTLFGDLTVRQTVRFAALLRGKTTAQADAVTEAVGLAACADQAIGGANIDRQISGGQRRRVSVAIELVLDPSLLLADESTSGLDAASASRVFGLLAQMAKMGRTVVASLHQPSDAMFAKFDKLGLLVDGRCVFFGPASLAASHVSVPVGVPVADYLLLAIGNVDEHLALTKRSSPPSSDDLVQHAEDLPWTTQAGILVRRSYLAHRLDIFDRMFLTNISTITLTTALLWMRVGARRPRSSQDVDDVAGLLFFQLVYWGFQCMLVALFAFPVDINVLKKERAAGLYKVSAFFVARTAVDTVTASLVAPALSLVYYFVVGLRPKVYGGHFAAHLMNGLVAHSSGLCIGAWIHNLKRAAGTQSIFMLCTMLLGGFYVQGVPTYLRWLNSFSFTSYAYRAMMKLEFDKSMTYDCDDRRCGLKEHDVFDGIDFDDPVALDFLALALFVLALRLLAYLGLRVNTNF